MKTNQNIMPNTPKEMYHVNSTQFLLKKKTNKQMQKKQQENGWQTLTEHFYYKEIYIFEKEKKSTL